MAHDNTMILDHIGFQVSDFAATKAFLLAALKPLDIGIVSEDTGWAMIGRGGKPQFWLARSGRRRGRSTSRSRPRTASRCDASTPPRWRRADRTTARRACARTTIPTTTAPS